VARELHERDAGIEELDLEATLWSIIFNQLECAIV